MPCYVPRDRRSSSVVPHRTSCESQDNDHRVDVRLRLETGEASQLHQSLDRCLCIFPLDFCPVVVLPSGVIGPYACRPTLESTGCDNSVSCNTRITLNIFPSTTSVLSNNSQVSTCLYSCLLFLTFSALVANPKKTTLHGGQSRSWSAEQGKKKKKKSGSAPPPPPARAARSEKK